MTRSVGRASALPPPIWSSAAVLLACACSKAPPDTSLPPLPDLPPAAASVPGRLRQLSAAGDELRRRIDPREAGWASETLAQEIESRLRAAIEALLSGRAPPESAWRALLAPDFAGATELFGAQRTRVYDDDALRVEQAAPDAGGARQEPTAFVAELARWKESLGALAFESVYLNVERIELAQDGSARTRLDVRVAARNGARAQQQNLVWEARWSFAAQGRDPRLLELSLARCQFVEARQSVFREVTQEVFGALPFYREEILRGAQDYHLRQDVLSRQPVLGMHGIAVGDADGDGLEDLYLAQPGGQPNRLLLRQRDGGVRDVSLESGTALLDTTGPVLFADLDGDGDEDLALGIGGNVIVRWNDGHGRFAAGDVLLAPDPAEITSMSVADVDNDGDLDLYACRYVAGGVVGGAPVPYHDAENGARDLFWKNDGAHKFHEALAEVGLDEHTRRFGLALYFEDFDEDGWIDLYVVNDFGRNCLYKNERGRFHDVAPELGLEDQAAGMGADMADVNGDGRLDLYVTNMHSPAGGRIARQPAFPPRQRGLEAEYVRHARGNTLLLARADGTFEDATESAGVAPAGWAWGARFLDWQNDGWPDIFVPNGFVSNYRRDDLESFFWREVIGRTPGAPPVTEEYAEAWDAIRHFAMFEGWSWNGWERKYAYLNLGQGRFADVSAASGLDFEDDSRAAVTLDWDEDGREDLLLRNRSGPRLRLLLGSQPNPNHFLELALASPGPNRDAIGAQVHVEAGGRSFRQSVHVGQGFLCASSRRLHFGLGRASVAERVRVRWPGGREEEFRDVALDARYRVLEGSGKLEKRERAVTPELDARPGTHVTVLPRPEPRIVLFDKLPLAPLSLPSFTGTPKRVAELAGKPLLLTVLHAGDPRSRAWLEWRARSRGAFEAAGCEQRFVLLDESAQLPAAKELLKRLGFLELAGAAQARFRQTLEVCLIEVLGPFPSLPLPLELVLDRGGRLMSVHAAPEDGARLLEDVRVAARIDPARDGTEALLGGEWAKLPARQFEQVAEIFQALGLTDMATFYGNWARAHARR